MPLSDSQHEHYTNKLKKANRARKPIFEGTVREGSSSRTSAAAEPKPPKKVPPSNVPALVSTKKSRMKELGRK